jgi:hypothetical protein
VSVVHVCKGDLGGPFFLDGRGVPIITAYLFHAGGHEAPAQMKVNEGKSFIGVYVLGMGFTFDDTGREAVATPLAEMERLIAKDARNNDRIFPYIGGEEVNDSPTHAHRRYVISFENFPLKRDDLGVRWVDADDGQREGWLKTGIVPLDYPEPVAADWPNLLDIVESKVKPERLTQKDASGKRYWWRFLRTRPEMRAAVRGLPQVIVLSRIGNALAFTTLPASIVPNEKTVVFSFRTLTAFAALQSRVHELWTRFFSSTLKDDLQYTPSECFETFPFPADFETLHTLEQSGREYYEFRARLMIQNNEGLTATYNRFHDPDADDPGILRLRQLHDAMDRAVLDAYGWTDIQPQCEFLLDFEEEEEDEESGPRRRKKPWRYRWPDEIRDEVLARLLELNRQRAIEEGQVPVAAESGGNLSGKRKRRTKTVPAAAGALLIGGDPE